MKKARKSGKKIKSVTKQDGSQRAREDKKNHRAKQEKRSQKDLKNFQKPLDKLLEMWYNRKACELIKRNRRAS